MKFSKREANTTTKNDERYEVFPVVELDEDEFETVIDILTLDDSILDWIDGKAITNGEIYFISRNDRIVPEFAAIRKKLIDNEFIKLKNSQLFIDKELLNHIWLSGQFYSVSSIANETSVRIKLFISDKKFAKKLVD